MFVYDYICVAVVSDCRNDSCDITFQILCQIERMGLWAILVYTDVYVCDSLPLTTTFWL